MKCGPMWPTAHHFRVATAQLPVQLQSNIPFYMWIT